MYICVAADVAMSYRCSVIEYKAESTVFYDDCVDASDPITTGMGPKSAIINFVSYLHTHHACIH